MHTAIEHDRNFDRRCAMTDATLHAILHARLLEVLSELKRHGAPTPATGQCCWGLMKTSSPPRSRRGIQ